MTTQRDRVARLLADHGRTYAEEIGIRLADTPAPLFQWLTASLLLSARIGANLAIAATRALIDAGLTTARHTCDAGWERRAQVLHDAGYGRYDESGSTRLGDSSALLLDRYGGDLRKLFEEAGGDQAELRRLVQEFKGIGPVGADIFCREAQGVWREFHPFADERALSAAKAMGLPGDAAALAKLVDQPDFPRLLAALVRVSLAHREGDY